MADIDIESKGTPGWIWSIPALLLLGLLFFWLMPGDDREVAVTDPVAEPMAPATEVGTAPAMAATPVAVEAYVNECSAREPSQMGLDHQYTSNCIRSLVQAINSAVTSDRLGSYSGDLAAANAAANRLAESGTQASDHSRIVQEALTAIGRTLDGLQEQGAPARTGRQVNNLTEQAQAIQPGRNLLDQRSEVQEFFAAAGEALQNVAGTRPAGAR